MRTQGLKSELADLHHENVNLVGCLQREKTCNALQTTRQQKLKRLKDENLGLETQL